VHSISLQVRGSSGGIGVEPATITYLLLNGLNLFEWNRDLSWYQP